MAWVGIRGGGKWSDLLVWLRRNYKSKVPAFKLETDATALERRGTLGQISRLFDQVDTLRTVPWNTVQKVLETHREAVVDRGGGDILGGNDTDS